MRDAPTGAAAEKKNAPAGKRLGVPTGGYGKNYTIEIGKTQ